MNIKECMNQRRSIRRYKSDEVTDDILFDLIDCARLAPSACNSQPWRFKIVKDANTKQKLAHISFNQKHISQAPVVLVCCADIQNYISGSFSGTKELYERKTLDENFYKMIHHRIKGLEHVQLEKLSGEVSFNVPLAMEHIILRAVELGLGSCLVKIADEKQIRELFGWNENIRFVSLLTLGYPDEIPKPLKKLSVEELLL